ncbi:hypothetical protein NXS15_01895 [Mycoplasma sp. CSL7475-4]|uniref:hypothetical protein n=1 Tax=Mycoplasma sp. CSL7475-4 TaxID=2973942 RepID=UPI00216B2D9B|nr:hypothetical protein [Mycoplasma sp. CSL7475-4]MCS4536871.1 hypothetical protein [Mycoplasma sp. CSL7475-4]
MKLKKLMFYSLPVLATAITPLATIACNKEDNNSKARKKLRNLEKNTVDLKMLKIMSMLFKVCLMKLLQMECNLPMNNLSYS